MELLRWHLGGTGRKVHQNVNVCEQGGFGETLH